MISRNNPANWQARRPAFLPGIFRAAALALCLTRACSGATNYYFDTNGTSPGAGLANGGSYAWSGSYWSTATDGTGLPGTLPSRNNSYFSAGFDGYASITLTGATGETGSIIVQEGNVTIQSLTRIFNGGSTLKTYSGTSLAIQNSPDFYNNTVYLDAAENSTITLVGTNSGGVRRAYIVKSGGGLVVFQNSNIGASGGTLTVNDGEYRIQNNASIADGATVVNAGGTLSLSNNISPARNVTISGAGYANGGALRGFSGNNSWLGAITLAGDARINADAGSTLTLNPTAGDAVAGSYGLTLGGEGAILVSDPIRLVASLTKDGTGTVTLAAVNPYSGLTSLTGGTLRLVESAGVLATTGGAMRVDATLEVDCAAAQTLSNSLSGSGRILKTGAGTLSLSAGGPFTGSLDVNAGRVSLAGGASLGAAGRITLSQGATFDVSPVSGFILGSEQMFAGLGTVAGSVTAADGSVISPGTDGNPGTLAFSNSQLWNGGVTALFDLAATPEGAGDLIAVSGNLVFNGSNTIQLAQASLANGLYPLVRTTGGTISGAVASLQLQGFPAGAQVAALQLNANATELDLVVSDNPYVPQSLAWIGDGGFNAWDKTTASWSNGSATVSFTDWDSVTFDDSGAANSMVTLTGPLAPGAVTVAASGDYTFTGAGALEGTMSLVKNGPGRLTIENSNSYSGGTVVNQGTLDIRNGAGLGSGVVTNNAALALSAPVPITVSNVISGSGTVSQTGGTTILSGTNTFAGEAVVSAGTLILGNPAALGAISGGTTVETGATLDPNGLHIGAEPLALQGGIMKNGAAAEAVWNGPVDITTTSMVDGENALTMAGTLSGAGDLTKNGACMLTLAGTGIETGAITVAAGTLNVTGSTGPGAVIVSPGSTLAGTGTINGPVTLGGTLSLASAPATLTINQTLVMQGGGSTVVKINRSLSTSSHDSITGMPQVTFGGTLTVQLSGPPLQEGDTFRIFQATAYHGGFSDVRLPYLTGSLLWDSSSLASSGTLRVISLPASGSTTEQRRNWLLTRLADNPGGVDGFSAAGGFFARGDIDQGRTYALNRSRSLLANHLAGPVQVDLFYIWPAVDLVARYGQYLDQETKDNIRQVVLTFNQYKDTTTSNLKTLSWVTRFLGSELYGEDAFDAAVDSSGIPITNDWRASDPNARSQLLSQLSTVVTAGYGEIASRPYFWKNLLPILSLGQLAQDPVIRQRAALAYEAGLAQCAGYWLRGHLGMPTTRSYPDMLNQFPLTSLGMLWFHFGGEIPPVNSDSALMAAVMNPKVSPVLELAASDRSAPFLSRSKNGANYLQAWVGHDYSLFADGPVGPNSGQVYPNGVVWTDSNLSRYSMLWVTKPIEDDSGLYVSATHGKETRQFHETVARDALLYIFDISPPAADDTTPTPYGLGYVPGGYRAVVNDAANNGHIFLHYGSVLIAIRSEIPFGWNPASGIAFPSATPLPGDSEFIIDGDTDPARPPATLVTPLTQNFRFALAIETASPAEFPGATPADQLAAFRGAVLATPGPARTADTTPTAVYTTRHGDQLRLAFSSDITTHPVSVNSSPVEYGLWPDIENPWIYQPQDRNVLILRSPDRREVIDFDNWTRTVTTGAIDMTPPVLENLPGNLTVTPDYLQPVLTFSATATDDVDGAVPVIYTPPNGSVFTPGTTTVVTATATDSSLNRSSSSFTVTVLPYTPPPPPSSPWSVGNIGAQPLTPGAATHNPVAGVFTISGTGGTSGTGASGDIWSGTSEGFTYVSQPWTGDGVFTARLFSFSASDSAAKAGIMFRETLATGARNSITYMSASGGAFFQNKTSTGGNVSYSSTSARGIPQWIRLVRSGNTFTGFFSGDGVTWTQQGTAVTNTMSGNAITVGLAVAPRTGGSTAEAVFDNVSFLPPPTALESWRQQYFGTTANSGKGANAADPDGDGLVNLMEYALGTLPNSAASAAPPVLSTAGNRLVLSFNRARGDVTYIVEGGSDLSTWTPVSTNPGSVGQNVIVTDTVDISPANPPSRFLRLRITDP